jgi:hypothetical protein
MKWYIFITNEGFTFTPNSECQEPDIENCQVIGFGKGENAQKAFEDMLISQEYLMKTNFDKIIGLELKNEVREYFFLTDYKPTY